jgi:hypothetical protein
MSGNSIYVAVPAYGNRVTVATLNSIYSWTLMCMQKGIGGGMAAFSYPEVSESRNIMLTSWYDNSDASHLLFVDSDMGFSPQLILDMLSFGEPLVGALYSKKAIPTQWAASGMGTDYAERRGDFMKLAGIGMGVCLIKREVVTKMLDKFPELSDSRIEFHAARTLLSKRIIRAFDSFDNPDDRTHGRMSEDLSFCCRWRQCGGDVWAAIGHDIEHVGDYSYTANYLRHITEKEAAAELLPPPNDLAVAAE